MRANSGRHGDRDVKKCKSLAVLLAALLLFSCFASAATIDIDAACALLADAKTGQILYAKNERERAYPASITKLMTALLVAEKGGLSETITVSASALENLSAAGSTVGLKTGEQLTVDQLLVCLLVASANEAANILGEHVAGSVDAFVEQMNRRAEELGCVNTHFANAHGLHDENHYTCAYDVYLIAREVEKHARLVEIVAMQKATIPATNLSPERLFFNTNSMLSPYKERTYLYKYTTGIKTGHTSQAGLCLAASAEKGDTSLLSVVLGAKTGENNQKGHFVETRKLFEWGFANFKTATVLDSTSPVGEVAVRLAWDRDHVIAAPKQDFSCMVPADYSAERLEVRAELPQSLDAPIEKGAALGTATLVYDGQTLGTVELVAADAVERSQLLFLWDSAVRFFSSWIAKIILIALAIFVIFYIIFTIRYNKRRRNARRYRGRRR